MNYRKITKEKSPQQVVELLESLSPLEVAKLIRDQIPMYIGSLNKTWVYWNDVVKKIDTKALVEID
ncbi:MAG: hypothetical protein AAFO07_04205 [Bacteroidota bacterium]